MPNNLFNWTYTDIVEVLKEHGFHLNHIEGSHHFYVGFSGGMMRQVCVPRHGTKSFKPRTVKGMILQSGLPKKDWGIK
ncbi:MAG: type II toxin-antitoxin system HicA family toxin [Patescibacteria group bacterium]|nr:type II toxin-antitoxin system HicA family toxin [Patescibacteria group bacterium]